MSFVAHFIITPPIFLINIMDDESSCVEQEYEVEAILDHQRIGRNAKYVYLVRWLGYDASHDVWINEDDSSGFSGLVESYHSALELAGVAEQMDAAYKRTLAWETTMTIFENVRQKFLDCLGSLQEKHKTLVTAGDTINYNHSGIQMTFDAFQSGGVGGLAAWALVPHNIAKRTTEIHNQAVHHRCQVTRVRV